MSNPPEDDAIEEERRWLPFDGAGNFRDLGGYEGADGGRVQWGMAYRSDMLARLSDEDLPRLQGLDIRLICDLRSEAEQLNHPSRLPEQDRPEVFSLTIWPQTESSAAELLRGAQFRLWEQATDITGEDARQVMCSFYRSYITHNTGPYGALLKRLCHHQHRPVLIHCAAGKDRTGVGAALLLRALGVSEEQVIEDYILTNRRKHKWTKKYRGSVPPAHVAAVLRAEPDYLCAALEEIVRGYGSFNAYLREGLGISDRERDQLRQAFLV